jgi:hypothetical protein
VYRRAFSLCGCGSPPIALGSEDVIDILHHYEELELVEADEAAGVDPSAREFVERITRQQSDVAWISFASEHEKCILASADEGALQQALSTIRGRR